MRRDCWYFCWYITHVGHFLAGAYTAIGVYNQFVWIDPASRTVIAKTSAFRRYAADLRPESYHVSDHFAFFRAIAEL